MMATSPDFITALGSDDVLVGRGAPSNANEGNKRFRDLVQSRKREYMSTGKRQIKDRIAREIVDTILQTRGGRFVRKIESLVEAEQMGVPEGSTAWTVVPLDLAIQKTKQALRDRDAADSSNTQRTAQQRGGESPTQSGMMDISGSSRSAGSQGIVPPVQPLQNDPVGDYLRSFRQVPGLGNAIQGDDLLLRAAAQQRMIDALAAERAVRQSMGLGLPPHLALRPGSFMLDSTSSGSPMSPDLRALLMQRNRMFPPPQRLGLNAHQDNFGTMGISTNVSQSNQFAEGVLEQDHHPLRASTPQVRRLSPPSTKMSDNEDTKGEVAMRQACERVAGKGSKSQNEFLELSLVEILLLSSMCSHGLPAWTPAVEDSFLPRTNQKFTWSDFATAVEKTSKDWIEAERERASRGNEDRVARIKRSSNVELALLEAHPKELARKTVMLMESLVDFVKESSCGDKKDGPGAWFEEEMRRWASYLDIAGESGRPIACNSQAMIKNIPELDPKSNDSLRPLAFFSREECRDVFAQISCITRARSVVEKASSSLVLRTQVEKASAECDRTKRVWTRRPSWWSNDPDSVAYDVLLLERLVRGGFNSFESTGRSSPSSLTLQKLGLNKAGIQERIEQLVYFLHEGQVAEERRRIIDDRKRKFLADLGLGTASSPDHRSMSFLAARASPQGDVGEIPGRLIANETSSPEAGKKRQRIA